MVEERQRETQWEQKTWLSQRGTAGSNRKPKNVSGKEEEDEEGVDGERGNTAERDDDSLQKSALALQLWKRTDVIDVRLTLFSQQQSKAQEEEFQVMSLSTNWGKCLAFASL